MNESLSVCIFMCLDVWKKNTNTWETVVLYSLVAPLNKRTLDNKNFRKNILLCVLTVCMY